MGRPEWPFYTVGTNNAIKEGYLQKLEEQIKIKTTNPLIDTKFSRKQYYVLEQLELSDFLKYPNTAFCISFHKMWPFYRLAQNTKPYIEFVS